MVYGGGVKLTGRAYTAIVIIILTTAFAVGMLAHIGPTPTQVQAAVKTSEVDYAEGQFDATAEAEDRPTHQTAKLCRLIAEGMGLAPLTYPQSLAEAANTVRDDHSAPYWQGFVDTQISLCQS